MKAQLCKCNNCGTIMIDENPSDAPELEIPDNVSEMQLREDEDKWFYWACPVCLTDAYLIDITE